MTLRSFLTGDVTLFFSGGDPAVLLDLVTKAGLSPRSPFLCDNGLSFSLPPASVKRLPTVLRKKGGRFRIQKKSGLPFLLKKSLSRRGLWVGFFLTVLSAFLLSSFIWTVEITGLSPDTAEKVRSFLSDHGLHSGVPASSVDPVELRSLLLEEIDELDWAAVNLLGSRAWIQAMEASPIPQTEYLSRNLPSDLVAAKSGYLLESRITLGETLILPGSAVSEGDVLVSHIIHGIVPGTKELSGAVRFVHASGVAIARTAGRVSAVLPFTRLEKLPTGESFTRNHLLFPQRTNFFLKNYGIPYTLCDKIEERYPLTLPGGQELPVWLSKSRYEAFSLMTVEIPDEEAEVFLKAMITRQLLSEAKDGCIESLQTTLRSEGNRWRMDADYIMTEDIGRVVPVDPDP